MSSNSETTEVQKLKAKIKCLKEQLRREKKKKKKKMTPDEALTILQPLLPTHFFSILKDQVRLAHRNKHGRRYDSNTKTIALSIFHSSPQTYKLLRKIFLLPSIRTLKRDLDMIHLKSGFNTTMLDALKAKVKSMDGQQKKCALVFDEMGIKESITYNSGNDTVEGFEDGGLLGTTKYVANHATVFMVKGLATKWKQPVGYFFSSGPMKAATLSILLLQCLGKMKQIGLEVKVVICDQGSNNMQLLRQLGVTVEKPYFMYNSTKVYAMPDPPHLLKNIRNNLKTSGYSVGDDEIYWGCIEEFYSIETSQELRCAPKLRDRHILLPPFSKMKVKLAAQVLSHSVAAGMKFYIQKGLLQHPAASSTAGFLQSMDDLFDSFNSRKKESAKPFKGALSATSPHTAFWEKCSKWLAQMKSLKAKSSLPCIEGWQQAIKCTLLLFEELKDEGFDYLLTNRLNQVNVKIQDKYALP